MANAFRILASLCLAFVVRELAEVQLGETTISGLSLPELNQEFFGGQCLSQRVNMVWHSFIYAPALFF